jgi:hypothetical protein
MALPDRNVYNPYARAPRTELHTRNESMGATMAVQHEHDGATKLKLAMYVAVHVDTDEWGESKNEEDAKQKQKRLGQDATSGRIVKIAWVVYAPNGDILQEECHITKPIGWTFSKEAEQRYTISMDG